MPKGSPAEKAGIKPTMRDRFSGSLVLGDIITGIDGKAVKNYSDLVRAGGRLGALGAVADGDMNCRLMRQVACVVWPQVCGVRCCQASSALTGVVFSRACRWRRWMRSAWATQSRCVGGALQEQPPV